MGIEGGGEAREVEKDKRGRIKTTGQLSACGAIARASPSAFSSPNLYIRSSASTASCWGCVGLCHTRPSPSPQLSRYHSLEEQDLVVVVGVEDLRHPARAQPDAPALAHASSHFLPLGALAPDPGHHVSHEGEPYSMQSTSARHTHAHKERAEVIAK